MFFSTCLVLSVVSNINNRSLNHMYGLKINKDEVRSILTYKNNYLTSSNQDQQNLYLANSYFLEDFKSFSWNHSKGTVSK